MDDAILYDHTQHEYKLSNTTDDFTTIMNPEFLSLEEYFPSGCLEEYSAQPLSVALADDETETRSSITDQVSPNSTSVNPDFSHTQNYLTDVIKMESRETVESGFSYFMKDEGHKEMIQTRITYRSKSITIDFDEISKHFDVPITKAAKRMDVGLTALKKRCRELNINRWPHRKIQSLKSLIDNLKEMGYTDHRDIEMLEEDIRRMEKSPDIELNHRTKKLRQACFKANYKKRRATSSSSLTKEHHHPWGLYA
ncbi:hypothetical protein MKW94_008589 [Papaver nudicaule]|uniref:RWP-RK domain-containing protein n=1 Tax=Papaver nudicaule TaxID=74823 RepID=A0AA41RPM2_PAPNU|nr:hypothetical protein [Papaver nudicaule]